MSLLASLNPRFKLTKERLLVRKNDHIHVSPEVGKLYLVQLLLIDGTKKLSLGSLDLKLAFFLLLRTRRRVLVVF
jgi:hypothetical protein